MKSMKNFAAQQLSKKQMNDVKGGEAYLYLNCSIRDKKSGEIIEYSHSVIGKTMEELSQNMAADLGENLEAIDCRGDIIC